MNFPILSAIIFIPLIGALFILLTKGNQKNVEKNSKYVAIFTSIANLLLSIFLWLSFDNTISDFQFIEEKKSLPNYMHYMKLYTDGTLRAIK